MAFSRLAALATALALAAFPAFAQTYPARPITLVVPFAAGGPLQVVQHQVSFLIEGSGNVTPSWKFVDVSANTGGSLFSLNRNRKDTLLITMGPTQLGDRALRKARVGPTKAVEDAHLAKQIGNSLGSNLLIRR